MFPDFVHNLLTWLILRRVARALRKRAATVKVGGWVILDFRFWILDFGLGSWVLGFGVAGMGQLPIRNFQFAICNLPSRLPEFYSPSGLACFRLALVLDSFIVGSGWLGMFRRATCSGREILPSAVYRLLSTWFSTTRLAWHVFVCAGS